MNPGTAKTGRFHFSTATLCIAPMTKQAEINPLEHSVGLVKNVKVDVTTSKVDLTQGIQNDIVASVVNGMPMTGSGEVYEYTASNFAYGLSQDPTGLVDMGEPVLVDGPTAAAATEVTLAEALTGAAVGSWIYIQENEDDQIHIAKLSAAADTTLTFTGYPIPVGMAFSAGARVGLLNKIDSDPGKANNNFAVRVIGIALDGNTPVTLHFPKCRITKGFSMAFSSDNFSNMPFEWTPLVPTPNDEGYMSDFKQKMSIFSR
jgi:hypothetical protein